LDVKAGEVESGSGAAFLEYVTRQGEEPEDHTHATEDEMLYVLEGALTFRCAGQAFDVEAGSCVFLPRGLEHGYTIRSATPVRLLVVTAPVREGARGGWGGFVADMEAGSENEACLCPVKTMFTSFARCLFEQARTA
jgi:quercetin dioxygenase-like cupin family protein